MSNLKLWDAVSETNPNYTKEAGYGRKFTSINAAYQIKQATEQFGVYGGDWGLFNLNYNTIDIVATGEILLVLSATFRVSSLTVEFPISSSIKLLGKSKNGLHLDDEAYKKVETDILTKSLSKLGFAADIFMGRYDDNKYVNDMKTKYDPATQHIEKKQLTDSDMLELINGMYNDFKGSIKMMGNYKKGAIINDVQYSATPKQLAKLADAVNTFKKENKFCDVTGNVLKWWVYSVEGMKKWNGEIYDTDLVYIDGVKYRLDNENLKKFTDSHKYKSKQDLNKQAK